MYYSALSIIDLINYYFTKNALGAAVKFIFNYIEERVTKKRKRIICEGRTVYVADIPLKLLYNKPLIERIMKLVFNRIRYSTNRDPPYMVNIYRPMINKRKIKYSATILMYTPEVIEVKYVNDPYTNIMLKVLRGEPISSLAVNELERLEKIIKQRKNVNNKLKNLRTLLTRDVDLYELLYSKEY